LENDEEKGNRKKKDKIGKHFFSVGKDSCPKKKEKLNPICRAALDSALREIKPGQQSFNVEGKSKILLASGRRRR